MGEGAKGASPFPLPQTPTPNPLRSVGRALPASYYDDGGQCPPYMTIGKFAVRRCQRS